MPLCYESYRFEPREALFSPGVAYPDADGDRPGDDGEERSSPLMLAPMGTSPGMTVGRGRGDDGIQGLC